MPFFAALVALAACGNQQKKSPDLHAGRDFLGKIYGVWHIAMP